MKNIASTHDFLAAVDQLTEPERRALEAYAERLIGGTPFSSGMDLIHEAVYRTLDARRNWPKDVDLGVFLANTARSIANTMRQRADASHIPLDDLHEQDDGSRKLRYQPTRSTEELALAVEKSRMTEAAIQFAKCTLAGDDDGIHVLDGMVADLSPKEMKEAFDLDDLTFDAARQRVMCRLKIWGKRHPQ
jgi:hypothetical protein